MVFTDEMAEQTELLARNNFGSPLFREIHKNSWLTKVSSNDTKKKKEKVWVVFCVHDDNEAFLETYPDCKASITHKPEWFISLQHTNHISSTICPHEQEYEFVVTLTSEIVRLAAPTWEQMLDWVESLRNKLEELRILSPKENLYSKLPENKGISLLPTRDPTSPLPPPPAIPPAFVPGVEAREIDLSETYHSRNHPILQRGLSLPEDARSTSEETEISQSVLSRDVFNFESINSVLIANNAQSPSRNNYDRLFLGRQLPGPSNSSQPSEILNSPNRLQAPPQPYRTLREQQVLQLQKEMKHPSGVRLQLRRKDCVNSIALVDAIGSVWICGWKQKEHPMLYNVLHIGDQLLSIEGLGVKTSNEAHKILRNTSSLYVNVIVKRIPFGEVFIIHRDVEGQPLGIVQDGNTAVIQTVQANSLVARHGLTAKTKSCDGQSFTNWVLTEINGRPLNLYFKENQVRDRLNSVGRDISILVQPLDLIKQLKKQMKTLRNYKDYLLQ